MIIPFGFGHVVHFFGGDALPRGAACTHGIALLESTPLADRAQLIADAMADVMASGVSSKVTYLGLRLKEGPNATGRVVDTPANVVGSGSELTAPPNVTLLVRKLTALGGRSNRGRMYMPGVAEGSVGHDGVLASGYLTGWQTTMNTYLDDIEAANSPMVILHSASSDPTLVSSLVVDSRVATQRDRLR